MPLTIEEAISRIPQWRETKDIRITALGGGITNSNYRIDIGRESFVLRIPGADTELLGINRDYEYAANLTAGKLGIAPEVYFYIQPEGSLVTRFINGKLIPLEEMKQPENIERVVTTVQKIHSMSKIPGVFNPFQVVRDYTKIARRSGVAFPENYSWLVERLCEAEEALTSQPAIARPCHNDLLNANFLIAGKLYILDWEYSGMGDRFFDLANFSDHHELSDELDDLLLRLYFDGDVSASKVAHLKIMKIMSDLREATWGLVQIGISKLDFDFREYADRFFDRVMQNIENPEWSEWLKEVRINA